MKTRAVTGAAIATVTVAASLVVGAAPASAANYQGCPVETVCLFQNIKGSGSKLIIKPTIGATSGFNLRDLTFINGQNANDQVSSVWNHISISRRLCAHLTVDIDGQGDGTFVGGQQAKEYGPGEVEGRLNDRLSWIAIERC